MINTTIHLCGLHVMHSIKKVRKYWCKRRSQVLHHDNFLSNGHLQTLRSHKVHIQTSLHRPFKLQ